jgi:dipeptidyl aminopeptidase/acylaminoacyl peptidase
MRSVLLAALLVIPSVARSQETASDTLLTVSHYLDWEQVADPQISPNGSQILYTRRWVNKIEDRWDSGLWIMNVDGSRNRFLVKGSNARWSPDGTRIGQILLPEICANIAFGGPRRNRLFMAAGQSLYSVYVETQGAHIC